ncbi:peptidase S1 [Micromonospora rosaria]|uniref:Peptidase S1 n=1 Tax=Micromonospora rosaria TaxID=47874 RepID=A0A136PWW6_9ACTN|nr:trypsin-like peptidase domain-containing protein [Micromonospora rosaria]KXK62922.1 peptidase S1 [Micromonospora rosaria]
MTEYESDPQRRPAPADAEPSPHNAELPRVDHGHSDPAAAGSTPGTPAGGTPPPSSGPLGNTPAAPAGSADGGQPAGSAADGGQAAGSGQPGPTAAGAGQPGPSAGDASPSTGAGTGADQGYRPGGYHPGGATPSAPPYPASGPSGAYQPSPWAPGQRGGWAGSNAGPAYGAPYGQQGTAGYGQHGTPGYQPGGGYGQPGQPGHPGQPGQPGHPGQPGQPGHPGQPVPPWAQGPTPRPSRAGRYVVAGVAVVALMFGSGLAGGALALAVGGGGITRTYSAAPVINGADLPRIAASVQDSVVSIATDSGEGSGVVLTADGYVLTNNHVIASGSANSVRVTFADGKNAQASVVGTDPKTDLAVLKANGVSGLKAATFGDSDAMQVGDQVLALGSPLGLQGSVTAGILSARDRTIRAGSGQQDPQQQGATSIAGLLQTDAPINPGNSGGALVNTRGEVIGINTAILTAGQGNGNIGVGFAIPSNKAKDVAEKLQRGEKVSHASLGVSVAEAQNGGALVASVLPGSAAEQAGLRQGDVITRFGDTTVNDSSDLVGAVQARKVGDRVEVRYQRDGNENTVTVTLTES